MSCAPCWPRSGNGSARPSGSRRHRPRPAGRRGRRAQRPRRAALRTARAAGAAPRRRRAGPRAAPDQQRCGRRRRHRRAAVSRGAPRPGASGSAPPSTRSTPSMGAVLGSAARLTRHGRAGARATMVELWLRRDGLDAARADPGLQGVLANPRLAAAVARVAADRDAAFDEWLPPHDARGSGPHRLAALMAEHAPGRAGAVDGWLPQDDACQRREGAGPRAAAVADRHRRDRAGDGGRPRPLPGRPPAARRVAPADRRSPSAHEQRPGGGRRPSRSSRRCCCASSGTSGPGWCRCTSGTSGSSPARCPASTRSPARGCSPCTTRAPRGAARGAVGPDPPGARPRARRGHPSLKALAERRATRTEPWVVAVLVGDGTPLQEDEPGPAGAARRAGLRDLRWCWSTCP